MHRISAVHPFCKNFFPARNHAARYWEPVNAIRRIGLWYEFETADREELDNRLRCNLVRTRNWAESGRLTVPLWNRPSFARNRAGLAREKFCISMEGSR
jgi:hypothetical protein